MVDTAEAPPSRVETTRITFAPLQPIALAAEDAAAFVGIGVTLFRELNASARTPAPIELGGRRLWSVADLRLWFELGCPKREDFQQCKKQQD